MVGGLFDAGFETTQQFVAALDDTLQPGFGVHGAAEDTLHFTIGDFTDLWQEAQAHTARMFGGVGVQLLYRDFGTNIFLVEARLLRHFVAGLRDGHITGLLVPLRSHFGAGYVFEELGHTLVDFGRFVGEDPQRCPPNDGVLRCTLDVIVVGQVDVPNSNLPLRMMFAREPLEPVNMPHLPEVNKAFDASRGRHM